MCCSYPNDLCFYYISHGNPRDQLTQSYFPSSTAQTLENDTGGSGKGITIALLTDALFSDAGWGGIWIQCCTSTEK